MKSIRILARCMLAALCLLSGGAGAQVVTEFSAGITTNAFPIDMAAGPDGNLCFAETSGNRIGRINTGLLAPVLLCAASRKLHGAAGTFDLPLLLTPVANPTTEPRQGSTATAVMTFDTEIISTDRTVTEGAAMAGAPTFSGNDVIVPLTGVSDAQYVTISLTNVASAVIGGGSGSLRLGILWGDVNQSRAASIADLGLVNAQLAQLVTVANFLKDVNSSSSFAVADKGIANANPTQSLPAPWLGVQPDASQESGPRKPGLTGAIHG